MPVLPYCVFNLESVLPEIVTGVQQAPVLKIEEGDIACLYSKVSAMSKDAGELAQAAMAFQSVVQQAFGAGVVIPFRFPTMLPGLDELGDHLRGMEETYSDVLERLHGKAQMEIKFSRMGLGGAAHAAPKSGTEYLKGKKNAELDVAEAENAVRDAAGDLIQEWRSRKVGETVRCFALIEHAKAADFKRAVGFVKPGAGIRAAVSGPWPPSEFLKEEA